jgi:hypothetical protein
MSLARALNRLSWRLRERNHVREYGRVIEDPAWILLDHPLDLRRGEGSVIPWTI